MLIKLILIILLFFLLLFITFKLLQNIFLKKKYEFISKLSPNAPSNRSFKLFGFFHPYCNAGGGGERVLWSAISALQKAYEESIKCVVYTGDIDAKREDILLRIKDRFNISLTYTDEKHLIFIYLTQRKWVEAEKYPRFTMFGQSLGSVWLGLEAMWYCVPDIYIDTMGYAFTYPLFKYLCGCKVGCYVHYPTVSTDMLLRVSNCISTYNNESTITKNALLSRIKIVYYKLFAWFYGLVGKQSDVVMVNSTWTHDHIQEIWKVDPFIVYPPCNVDKLLAIDANEKRDQVVKKIISIGQFRPEKDHVLQITSFAKFLKLVAHENQIFKLTLVGSCRNSEDYTRVTILQNLAKKLQVSNNVEFKLNVSFNELEDLYSTSTVALHTMWNEHFGIGIVECMAAGLITLAHNSGGPRSDIISTDVDNDATGFLACTCQEYADALRHIFCDLSDVDFARIRTNARRSVARFTDLKFERSFLKSIRNVLQ